jgi:hypothetical protein
LENTKGAGRTGALLLDKFKSERNYFPPILNIVVPQTSQTAFVAFLPFFMVTSCASFPSLLALHFTQYIIFITSVPQGNQKLFLAKYTTISIERIKLTKIRLFTMSFRVCAAESAFAKISALFVAVSFEPDECFSEADSLLTVLLSGFQDTKKL